LIVAYLFTHRSYKHINKVNEAFNHLSPISTLHETLKEKFSSTAAIACIQTIITYSTNPNEFIASQILNLGKKEEI